MPYIDAGGNFRYIIIPAEQCIPIYETDYEEELVAMLRYYPAVVGGEQKIRAEWWTAESVSTYIEAEGGTYKLESEDGHFFLNGTPMGWGRVPFVEFANNEERFADLKYYKEVSILVFVDVPLRRRPIFAHLGRSPLRHVPHSQCCS